MAWRENATITKLRVEQLRIQGANSYVSVEDAAAVDFNEADSGKLHLIGDLSQDSVFSLPAVKPGLRFPVHYVGNAADAHDWQFDTGSDTNYFIGGVVQHDPDNAGDDTVVRHPDGNSNSKMNVLTPDSGTELLFVCDGTNWLLNGRVISATDIAVTWADQ